MKLKYEYFKEITGGVSRRKITDEMTLEMKEEFLAMRLNTGFKYGFDGKKIVVPYEIYGKYERGHYFVADEDVFAMDEDLWNVDIPADVVVLKKDNPGMVIAYPVSDEPVVIVEDKENGVCSLAHCSIERINKEIPNYAVDAVVNEAGSNIKNLKVYISSNLKKENNYFLFKPSFINEHKKIWKDCTYNGAKAHINVNFKNDILNRIFKYFAYSIDQEMAIHNMLVRKGVDPLNITISDINTFSNPIYYSSAAESLYGLDSKNGKFLVGAYYGETFPNIKESTFVRKL